MSAFQYSSLSIPRREIRLITLQPRATGPASTISCTIEHASLDDVPLYSALSYTWGDASDRTCIRLNGASFSVTRNLQTALEQLLPEREPLKLWVDAICIQQEDNEEKGWQVGQMRDIYAKAAEVVIWLGPAYQNSDLAMQAFAAVGKEALDCGALDLRSSKAMDISKWAPIFIGKRKIENEGPLERLFRNTTFGDGKMGPFDILAIDSLLRRPWTRRVWVMQELAVAQNPIIMCGNKVVPCSHFDAALMFYRKMCEIWSGTYMHPEAFSFFHKMQNANIHSMDLQSSMDLMLSVRSDFQRLGGFALFHLMMLGSSASEQIPLSESTSQTLDASDPRDRIYAFLGLSRDSAKLGITPDYSKSFESICIQTTKAMLNSDFGPNWLSLRQQESRRESLPSWVIDWSSPLAQSVLSNSRYAAGLEMRPSMICFQTDGQEVLLISGIKLDTIEMLGPNMYEKPVSGDGKEEKHWSLTSCWLQDIELMFEGRAEIYGTIEKREEAIWRTLIRDTIVEEGQIKRVSKSQRRAYQLLHLSAKKVLEDKHLLTLILSADPSMLGNFDPGVILDKDPIMWQEASNYRSQMERENSGSRTFATSKGHFGVGPEALRPGDRVVIFGGCFLPYIIREVGKDLFVLLGGAYVHGVMDGEAVVVPDISHVKSQRFALI